MSLSDDAYHGVLPVVFGEGWAKLQAEGMDVTDQRQLDLVTTMSTGCARAIDAHGLRDLL